MGKDHDHVEWEHAHRLALGQLVSSATPFRQRTLDLKTQRHGGDWLLQNLRIFIKQYPASAVDILRRNAALGKLPVIESAQQAAHAAGEANGAGGSTLRGIRIFALDTENWPLTELERQLDEFYRLPVESISIDAVHRWTDWAQALELKLADFRRMLEEGRRFFTRANLALLPYVVEDPVLQEELLWMVLSREGEAKAEAPRKPSMLQRLLMGLNS